MLVFIILEIKNLKDNKPFHANIRFLYPQKTFKKLDFLKFSGCIKMDHYLEIGQYKLTKGKCKQTNLTTRLSSRFLKDKKRPCFVILTNFGQ